MKRDRNTPSPAQWRILRAIVEAGRLRRQGQRYVADEPAARSFGFTPVMHLVNRGLVQAADAKLTALEPTPLARRIVASAPGQSAGESRP